MELKCTVMEVEHSYKYERGDGKDWSYNQAKPELKVKLECDALKDDCGDHVTLTLPSGTDINEYKLGDEVILTVRKA